jgi:SAM-dependent methyltransferase
MRRQHHLCTELHHMIEIIDFQGQIYPAFQATGNAARFCRPFATELCQGTGYDIGCNRLEWCLPGAIPVDNGPLLRTQVEVHHDAPPYWQDGTALPPKPVDYIHSSHCLEHLPDWVGALDHWGSRLKSGGVLFLYLPHPDQLYWRPWNNRKHIHTLYPSDLQQYLVARGWVNVFVSERDLNHSFIATAQKP